MTMTITLHWWIWPIIVLLGTFLWIAIRGDKGAWDFGGVFILIGGVVAAVSLAVGHFL